MRLRSFADQDDVLYYLETLHRLLAGAFPMPFLSPGTWISGTWCSRREPSGWFPPQLLPPVPRATPGCRKAANRTFWQAAYRNRRVQRPVPLRRHRPAIDFRLGGDAVRVNIQGILPLRIGHASVGIFVRDRQGEQQRAVRNAFVREPPLLEHHVGFVVEVFSVHRRILGFVPPNTLDGHRKDQFDGVALAPLPLDADEAFCVGRYCLRGTVDGDPASPHQAGMRK